MSGFTLFKKQEEQLREEKNKLRLEWEKLRAKESEFVLNEEFGRVHQIPLEQITPNRSQPRTDFEEEAIIRLADSIRMYGIFQPLTVRRLEVSKKDAAEVMESESGNFELVAGERRLRAAKLIGMQTVPCMIIEADNKKSAELAVIENIQREDLNMFEQASAIASLLETHKMTQEQVAARLSVSQSFVANKLRILRLDEDERELILRNKLTERHARALLKFDQPDKRKEALRTIISKNMNVSTAEEYIEGVLNAKEEREPARRKFIIRDMRIFYNTIDKAVDTVRRAGITISSQRKEEDGFVELVIRIPESVQYKR